VRRTLGALVLALGATGAAAYEPRVNYQLQCMGCHTADGAGQPGRVPSVRDSLGRLALTPEGRSYLIRVPGVAQSPLSDADTAAGLNWMIKTLSDSPPDRFDAFTAEEVARWRHQPLAEVSAARAALLSDSSR
jgi:mono/diheme cytochrome c family protein